MRKFSNYNYETKELSERTDLPDKLLNKMKHNQIHKLDKPLKEVIFFSQELIILVC